MKTFKLWLLLALIFVSGVVSGVVATRVAVRHLVREVILHPEQVQLVMERNLTRRLQLDREQQTQLHQILTDTHGRMRDLRLEYQPRLFEIVTNADGQIVAILTPEQQARYERLKADKLPFLRVLEQNR
jgi:Spy/CpxP family protein refolding chaperone